MNCPNCGTLCVTRVLPLNPTYQITLHLCDNLTCKFYHIARLK